MTVCNISSRSSPNTRSKEHSTTYKTDLIETFEPYNIHEHVIQECHSYYPCSFSQAIAEKEKRSSYMISCEADLVCYGFDDWLLFQDGLRRNKPLLLFYLNFRFWSKYKILFFVHQSNSIPLDDSLNSFKFDWESLNIFPLSSNRVCYSFL